MTVLSTTAQLEEVQAAITAVMAGQSYRIGDVTFQKADLRALTEREERLLARYQRENRGSARTRINYSQGN
jgi:hypothetical protein